MYPYYNPRRSFREVNKKNTSDFGGSPYVLDISASALGNNNFREALWTGDNLQLTQMSIKPNEDIGIEVHPDVDQFLRIEKGEGLVEMGNKKNNLTYQKKVSDGFGILIPKNTWHNLTNIGDTDLKLYSIYSPPNHPKGTIHKTKADEIEE